LSVAVSISGAGTVASQAMVVSDGAILSNVGATVSIIVINLTALSTFPQPSVTVTTLLKVNSCGHAPAKVSSTNTSEIELQLSPAVKMFRGTAASQAIVVSDEGDVITTVGATVSITLMICAQLSKLPQVSEATKVLVIV
jgi:hypothetical protein